MLIPDVSACELAICCERTGGRVLCEIEVDRGVTVDLEVVVVDREVVVVDLEVVVVREVVVVDREVDDEVEAEFES